MDIFKPIKKWLIPFVFIILGVSLGYNFSHSKEELIYKEWVNLLKSSEDFSYKIKSLYLYDDDLYSKSNGFWTENESILNIETPISDGTTLSIEAYIYQDEFFVKSNKEWFKGDGANNFYQEITPLNNPFDWVNTLLEDAHKISKTQNENEVYYKAYFKEYTNLDFRGVVLEKQSKSTLQMTFKNDKLHSIKWHSKPIRPNNMNPLNSYPKSLKYALEFERISEKNIPDLPQEANSAKDLD